MLSSDPHAWLRPIFAQLQAHPAFRHFALADEWRAALVAVGWM